MCKAIRYQLIAACLGLTVSIVEAQPTATPTLTIEKIAFEGEPAPGTNTNFARFVRVPFSVPIINALGTIVFTGDVLVLPDLIPASGIWKSKGGVTSALVLKGDEAFGIALAQTDRPDVKPTLRDFGTININNKNIDGGVVAFMAGIDFGFGGTIEESLWTVISRGNQFPSVTCSDLGFPPATFSCFQDVGGGHTGTGRSPLTPMIDDAGTVVFGAFSSDNIPGIYRAKRPNKPTIIATVGQLAPDITVGVTFQSFSDFVLTPGGDVAFFAQLQGAGVTTNNDTAIFKETNKILGLVVREGDQTSGGVAGGTFGELAPPAINGSGAVAFLSFAQAPPFGVSIWTGTGPNDLELVANTGVPNSTAGGDIVTFSTFGPPVISDNGVVAFLAVDENFTESVWISQPKPVGGLIRIVQAGDAAPGTIGAVFTGFVQTLDPRVNIAINKAGHVAFVGLLDFNSPGVTLENRRGIWAEDPNGNPTLIAREGKFLEVSSQGETTILDRVKELSFAGGSGNADGRRSGFSDNGDLTFRATFNDGTSGIFRATFQGIPQPQPTGKEFIWNDQACDLKNWHADCGKTNWNDKDGKPQPAPPGDKGDEIVTITNATVFLSDKAVSIGTLTATGKLEAQKDITLAGDSRIEALQLLGGNLTAKGSLILTKAGTWQTGTIDSGANGLIVHNGTLETATAATGDPPRKIAGTKPFTNEGTVNQINDIDLSNAKIENIIGATWNVGNITVAQGDGTFINRGTLRHSVGNTTLDCFLEAHDNSRLEVKEGTLTLNRGVQFLGNSTIVLSSQLTLLFFDAVGGAGEYRVSPDKTVTVTPETPSTVSEGFISLSNNAVLNTLSNARFVMQRGTSLLLDGGQVNGPGTVQIQGGMSWDRGTIGLPDVGAGSGNVLIDDGARLSIGGVGTKTLAGTLTIGAPSGKENENGLPVVTETGDLTINGGQVILNAGKWSIINAATVTGSSGALFSIHRGQRIKTIAGFFVSFEVPVPAVGTLVVNADGDERVTFSASLNNEGVVAVRQGTLELTGNLAQLNGTVLTGGTWDVRRSESAGQVAGIELVNKEIKTIGSGATVTLERGFFTGLKLEKNVGRFSIAGSSFSTTGGLVNDGHLEVRTVNVANVPKGGTLIVNGTLTNRGTLVVKGSADSIEANVLRTETGSKTTINGSVRGVGIGVPVVLIVNGGAFSGTGVINSQSLENLGILSSGRSPGVMTINGDFAQLPEGTLEIEIGGTTAEIEHDQLVINGNAQLGGTLVWKAIDDFAPQAGQTVDFLSVSGTQTGQFENVEIVDLAPGFEFEVTPTDIGFRMTALTDGVFTGIVGEINDIAVGRETPEAQTTAVPGDPNVPMLQFDIVPEGDGLSLNLLTLQATGSGDDIADLAGVTLWVDEDGDGHVGPDEPAIGTGTYQADNGTLDLAVDPPHNVAARQTATFLLTYDIAGGEEQAVVAARNVNDKAASPKSRLSLGLGAITFPLFIALTLALGLALSLRPLASRRYRATALVLACILTGASIAGCPPDLTGGGISTVTFQVTLRAIGASEAGTNADASVDNLTLTGTTLTVRK